MAIEIVWVNVHYPQTFKLTVSVSDLEAWIYHAVGVVGGAEFVALTKIHNRTIIIITTALTGFFVIVVICSGETLSYTSPFTTTTTTTLTPSPFPISPTCW